MARPKTEYQRAVMVLNSCQYGSTFASSDSKSKKINMIMNCLERVGLKMEDINDKLSIIHVAGTKGKGSTCEYAQSILRHHGYKTGTFSSPHLIEVRERIRINGKPVSEEIFCAAFWHIFDRIQTTRMSNEGLMPGYFTITLLMAFHIFLEQKIDVVILEVGIGGEYDATNFIQRPVACGIASLHLEHTQVLGNTVEEISWHKSGIMKKGVPLVTVPQQDSVMAVIMKKAQERQCPVFVAPPLQVQEVGGMLGIAGERQTLNAALAVQLCRLFLEKEDRMNQEQGDAHQMEDVNFSIQVTQPKDVPKKESINLTPREKEGLINTRLPGRSQTVKRGSVTYYLDGAHTTESMQQCVAWFTEAADKEAKEVGGNVYRSLVFRMKASKKALDHLPYLKDLGFQRAAFCPHVISTSAREEFPDSMDLRIDPKDAKVIAASQLKDWNELQDGSIQSTISCMSRCFPSIASALWWAGLNNDTQPSQPPLQLMAEEDLRLETEQLTSQGGDKDGAGGDGADNPDDPVTGDATHVQVLVTGSLIMVGGALTIIKPELWD